MSCKRCASGNLKDFSAEIAIHFPGGGGLNKHQVFVSPKLMVCLDCRFAEFVIPNDQGEKLKAVINRQKGNMARILPEVW